MLCEVRVRYASDPAKWEDIPVSIQTDWSLEQTMEMVLLYLRTFHHQSGEIRINEIGSLQGHYFTI